MHVDVFMKRHNEPPHLVLDQEMTGPATSGEGSSLFFGHARACPGHARLADVIEMKT
jgi:hypothetical protein